MNNSGWSAISGLETLFEAGSIGGLSDGQLLDRFVDRREEAAVVVLIRRHGPMVFGVCRRVLQDPHDAEDAFQATFLVLARRAASVFPSDRVGPWLHGVAFQTARKHRASRTKRRTREVSLSATVEPESVRPRDHDERLARLDGEIRRLPARYRLPILLCDLGEKTHREAAEELGWPVGTVSGRLSRARAILARRLGRPDGVESSPLVASLLAQNPPSGLIPQTLFGATVRGMALLASGRSGAVGFVSAEVLALTQGVTTMMGFSRIKVVAVALMGLGLVGGGTGWSHRPPDGAFAASPQSKADSGLQGVWTGIVAEVGGNSVRPSPDMAAPPAQIHVEGDRLTLRGPIYGSTIGFGSPVDTKWTFQVDPSKNPKTIDLTLLPSFDDASPTVNPGIYQRNGDDLLLCLSIPNKKRPSKFATEAKTSQMLLKLVKDPSGKWSDLATLALNPETVEPPRERVEVEPALAKLAGGRIVQATEVSKDSMVLSYLPDWAFGNVDNIGFENHDGGVRTLVDWPKAAVEDANAPDRRFLLALYSRQTIADDRETPILAFEVEAQWPERTSWKTQPKYAEKPSAMFKFEPGEGWKVFDVTPLVRSRAREGREGQGIVLRFQNEDRSSQDKAWSGYQIVSREGMGEWKLRRPKLLVVEPAPK